MFNKDFMDELNIASFIIGLKNLEENLSQSDKDDLIESMSTTNQDLLDVLERDIEKQNEMLKEILDRLERIEQKIV